VPRHRDRCPLGVYAEVLLIRSAANQHHPSLTKSSSLATTTIRWHRGASQRTTQPEPVFFGRGTQTPACAKQPGIQRLCDRPTCVTSRFRQVH
jgi:hypothetical protein